MEVDKYPNATVVEFGNVQGADAMAKEIMTRGPIACGVDAGPLLNYTGGVISDAGACVRARVRARAANPEALRAG